MEIFPTQQRLEDQTPELDEILVKTKQSNAKKAKKMETSKPATVSNTLPNTQSLSQISPIISNLTDLSKLTKLNAPIKTIVPNNVNPMSVIPSNIESGSLVVLAVNDPNAPTKKMLQTYISDGKGRLSAINLPPNLLNSVAGYMKKGSPRSVISPNNRSTPSPATKLRQDSHVMQL